jgi:hypothetical protein
MNPASRQMIMEALREAMSKEELHTRGAAQALNLNPCYVSMALNPKSWDSMGKAPWIRLTNWYNTREPLGSFQIPDGEEIWKPKERDPAARITEPETPKKAKKEKKAKELNAIDTYSPKYVSLGIPLTEIESEISKSFAREELRIEQKKDLTTRIPIQLDLRINIEVLISGKPIQP